MTTMIRIRKRKRYVIPPEPVMAPIADEPLVFDEQINALVVQLTNYPQGMEYDFCNVEPHRSLRKLEAVGLVQFDKHNTRFWVASLTQEGRNYAGVTVQRQRRRRRRKS